jgi:deoxycytidylate deaminase
METISTFRDAIAAAREENDHAKPFRGGKKYTTVAVRVELMRRHFGDLGVSTEIVEYGRAKGDPVVVKATITDASGRVLATGHAEEIRGMGHVNTTSALENAETSAVGRALAALGISGGEFASANEMDAVERKADAAEPETPFDPIAARDRIVRRMSEARTGVELNVALDAAKADLTRLKEQDPPKRLECDAAYKAAVSRIRAATQGEAA